MTTSSHLSSQPFCTMFQKSFHSLRSLMNFQSSLFPSMSFLFFLTNLNLIINPYNHSLTYTLDFPVSLSLSCSQLAKIHPSLIQCLTYSNTCVCEDKYDQKTSHMQSLYIYELDIKWITTLFIYTMCPFQPLSHFSRTGLISIFL